LELTVALVLSYLGVLVGFYPIFQDYPLDLEHLLRSQRELREGLPQLRQSLRRWPQSNGPDAPGLPRRNRPTPRHRRG
jgi:hypothetical protein